MESIEIHIIITIINIIVKFVCSLIFLNIFHHIRKEAFKIMVIASFFTLLSSCFQLIYLLNQDFDIFFVFRGAFEAAGTFSIIAGIRSFLLEKKADYLVAECLLIIVTTISSYFLINISISALIAGSIQLLSIIALIFSIFLEQKNIRKRLDRQSVVMSLILITYGLIYMLVGVLLALRSNSDMLVIDIILSPTILIILVYFIILENNITNRIKLSLIDNYSHDIGNSNQIIFSSIEYLLQKTTDEERKEVMILINKEIGRINNLITEIRGLK